MYLIPVRSFSSFLLFQYLETIDLYTSINNGTKSVMTLLTQAF